MKQIKISIIAAIFAAFVFAVAAPPQTRAQQQQQQDNLKFDDALRNDFSAGMGGDAAALERALRRADRILAGNPADADALVWRGSATLAKSGKAFADGDFAAGAELWQKGLNEMDRAVELAPESFAVRVVRGSTVLNAAKRYPDPAVARSLSEKGAADYEKLLGLQDETARKAVQSQLARILGGLAEAYERLGDKTGAEAARQRLAAIGTSAQPARLTTSPAASSTPAKTIEMQSRFAEFENAKVHYEIGGAGKQTLVFVHGWASNRTFWQAQLPAFTDFQIVAIDLPGHGESDKPPVEYTMEHFARAIAAVLKTAKIERAVFVGHSMGTPVIRQFYRLYPQQAQALVIVDGPLRPYASEAGWKRMFAPLRENYKKNAPQYAQMLARPNTPPEVTKKLADSMLATPDYVAVSAMDGMAAAKNWTDDKINVPVLAVMAKAPPLWKDDTEAAYRELAPNLEFEAWEDASHMLMMEQPERFNQTLRRFLVKNKFAKK